MRIKTLYFIVCTLFLFSCSEERKTNPPQIKRLDTSNQIFEPKFQEIIALANVMGSILVFDFQEKKYYSNNFEWANKAKLPASTFKIPNSIIALETNIIENDSTILKWDKQERALDIWEKDLTLTEAFRSSCVPCYQEIARNIGSSKMNHYIDKFQFGDMDIDSINLDLFWLQGDSKITSFEQIDFLKRFYKSKLPIRKSTEDFVKKMMQIKQTDTYTLSGKTGWSVQNGNNNGWFVGYLEKGNDIYFFATNIDPTTAFDMDTFPTIRKSITLKALQTIELIN